MNTSLDIYIENNSLNDDQEFFLETLKEKIKQEYRNRHPLIQAVYKDGFFICHPICVYK